MDRTYLACWRMRSARAAAKTQEESGPQPRDSGPPWRGRKTTAGICDSGASQQRQAALEGWLPHKSQVMSSSEASETGRGHDPDRSRSIPGEDARGDSAFDLAMELGDLSGEAVSIPKQDAENKTEIEIDRPL